MEPFGGEGFTSTQTRNADGAKRFILVAGEASGDLLGADLIAGLKPRFPNATFAGIGGPRMREAGMELWYPSERLSVMGYIEVLKHLPGLLALRREVYRRTLSANPDVFIGIDAPDFNLGLERKLKHRGIRTVHYVSPSVWAWKEKRAATIGRSADRVLCLFPMEPPIYAQHGVAARFVGHPLADVFSIEPDRRAARRALDLADDALVLAILPGSRLGEIERLGRDFLGAARLLAQQFPQLQIVAPMANAPCRAAFEALSRDAGLLVRDSGFGIRDSELRSRDTRYGIRDSEKQRAATGLTMHILSPESQIPNSESRLSNPESRLSLSHQAMIAADAVLLASGTAALEAMLAKRPMVVAYRLAPATHRLVKSLRMLKTSVYSLPNILASKTLVPELMQDDCTPQALADALAPMLRARALPAATLQEFIRLHESLRGDANHNAASAIADLLMAANLNPRPPLSQRSNDFR